MAIVYLLGGGVASGKSTLAVAIKRDNPLIVYVMPEEMDEKIPDFVLERDHGKSAHLTREVLARAIYNRKDILCDYAMAGEYDGEFIKLLTRYGYIVHVLFVDVPIEKAKRWAFSRPRVVPENVLNDFHVRAARNFRRFVSIPGITSLRLYDNSGKFELVYMQGQEWKNGRTYDAEKFNLFMAKETLSSDGSGYHLFNTQSDIDDLENMLCIK
jgi:predicted ABC-type ATPase